MAVLNKRAITALLADDKVRLWSTNFGIDPLVDPFPASVASNILLVDRNTLAELFQINLISATCRVAHVDGTVSHHFCYWDILEATVLMSLLSVGVQVDYALEDANLIFDLVAYHYEEHRPREAIDVFMLSEIIKSNFEKYDFENRYPGIRLDDLSLKLAIDIMNVHLRCTSNFLSPSSGLCFTSSTRNSSRFRTH